MANDVQVAVPDIGDFDTVDVIDVLVKPGDLISLEDPLVTLESEKATMDIPAPQAGRVVAVTVKVGDKVSQGNLILTLAPLDAEAPAGTAPPAAPAAAPSAAAVETPKAPIAAAPAKSAPAAAAAPQQVVVPDIGDFEQVDVIDILVKVGDVISADAPLITLESEKATMDIPAPQAGRVLAVLVKVGDKVSEGNAIVTLETLGGTAVVPPPPAPAPAATPTPPAAVAPGPDAAAATAPAATANVYDFVSPDPGPRTVAPPASQGLMSSGGRVYASPGLRKFARELGVDLAQVKGSGRKGRLMKEDVAAFVKQAMQQRAAAPASGGFAMPAAPVIDFTKFGPIDTQPLNKIRRLTGQNLHRAWITIPHVTQFDEADITELEAFRRSKLEESEKLGAKLTLVAFIMKAVAAALKRAPDFNSSLGPDGETLILKQYCHLGVAVNTPRGLLVPVVRDVDRKGIYALAKELRDLSTKARDGKLAPADMQGGCFTITSLGGISGTGFTPIINPPEVAILGVSPAAMKPVYRDGAFVPRLLLPLSLSYDHRVIDGVAAAEFTRYLSQLLGDIRQLIL